MNEPKLDQGTRVDDSPQATQERISLDNSLQVNQIGNSPVPEFLREVQKSGNGQGPSLFSCYLQDSEAQLQWSIDQGAIGRALQEGKPEEALEIARDAYERAKEQFGLADDATAVMSSWVGNAAESSAEKALAEGRTADAIDLLKEAAAMNTEAAQSHASVFGPLHPTVVMNSQEAAESFLKLAELTENPDEQRQYLEEAAERLEAVDLAMKIRWSPDEESIDRHRKVLDTLIDVSEALDDDEAKRRYEREREALLEQSS